MKKNYTCIVLITILLITGLFVFESDTKTFKIDGIKYAVSVDGQSVSAFPEYGSYEVEIECSGANASWNYEEWVAEIYDVTDDVSCYLSFNSREKSYLNEYIISLVGTTQGTGKVVNENGYRYEGKIPDNYIRFNNEIWRIIGVFDSDSHGIANTNLTKIIREDSIGGLVWNIQSSNNWSTSSLYNLLNNYYYNATDATDSGHCYNTASVTGTCDYRVKGIQDEYRNMVENVTWYLGGHSAVTATAEAFYGYERGTALYSGNDTTTTGYIGLMYPSDYGYSVLATDCSRTTQLGSYGTEKCAGSLWLMNGTYEWLLFHNSSDETAVFYANKYGDGKIYYTSPGSGFVVRPVLYLDSSVYILSGDGSIENPYTIGM